MSRFDEPSLHHESSVSDERANGEHSDPRKSSSVIGTSTRATYRTEATTSPKPPSAMEKRMVARLLRSFQAVPFVLQLWDGTEYKAGEADPLARLVVRDRISLVKLLADPEMQFGEAYCEGQLDVEGDLVAFLTEVYDAMERRRKVAGPVRRLWERVQSASVGSLTRARENIHHHYDLGNDFYKLWLDDQMVYTCAYFPTPTTDLEAAQVAKMDHVCKKLRLRPGESVVEAGCGWGSLALHMARHYGVTVRSFNISHEQIAYARERAKREQLASRVEFVEDDYRNITSRYDAFVSVGMLEHVGLSQYGDLSRVIDRSLSSVGRGLLHSIGRNRPLALSAWIRRNVFPGAYPPSLREMLQVLEPHGFSVLDVENLRLHYAKTLEHWLERFDAASGAIESMFDRRFVRMWRLYLAGSMAAFLSGSMQLFQVVFTRRTVNDVPWTRAGLYATDGS